MSQPYKTNFVLQPAYYPDFSCTASACPDTCCRGWNIIVDPDTYAYWNTLTTPIPVSPSSASVFPAHQLSVVPISASAQRYQLTLTKEGRCPMLTANGLCSMYAEVGEHSMPEVCKEFPRTIIEGDGISQRFISVRCPAGLDLLWKQKTFHYMPASSTGSTTVNPGAAVYDTSASASFPAKELLDLFLAIGNLSAVTSADLLSLLFHAIYHVHTQLSLSIPYGPDGYREFGQEMITPASIEEIMNYVNVSMNSDSETGHHSGQPSNDADIYHSTAGFETYHEILAALSEDFLDSPVFGGDFAKTLEASAELIEKATAKQLNMFRNGSYLSRDADHKLKLVLLEQLFSSVFTVQSMDYETILLAVQWLIIQYMTVRYTLFLDYFQGNHIDTAMLRHRITRIFRITDVAELTKLSFFDPQLRCWMWTPQKADELLPYLHPFGPHALRCSTISSARTGG